jgi:predicted DNA-binding transcriptional regulator AlpA
MSDNSRAMIDERYLTDVELADVLGLSRAMVHKMRGRGMPSHTFGRSRRYLLSEVAAWSEEVSVEDAAA